MKKFFLLFSLFTLLIHFTNAQPGHLDTSFGTNGIVKTSLGSSYDYELIGKQILLSNGGGFYAVLQSGGQTLITKRHTDGSVDSSYGQAGFSASAALVSVSAAFQQGEKIVVAGSNYNGRFIEYQIIRFNTNGSIDVTFGTNGIQTVSFSIASVAIQANGKIVVAGSISSSGNSYIGLGRYNADGGPDINFGDSGKQIIDFKFSKPPDRAGEYPESDFGYSVAIQSDGKIVTSGSAFNYALNAEVSAVARSTSDGKPDSSFNTNGRQTINFDATENYAYSIAFQNDEKIVVAGYANVDGSTYDLALARFNTNGTPDNTFSEDGKQTTGFGSVDHYPNSLSLQQDGKIVVEGDSFDGSNYDFSIARFNTDGTPDNTFNGNGKIVTDLGSTSDYANSVVIQNDGKIIEAGSTFNGNNYKLAIVRYNPNGSLDETFNGNGKLIKGLGQGYSIYTSSVLQNDRKLVASGYTWNGTNVDFVIARYNEDGSLDSSFSEDGKQTADFNSGDDFANSSFIQPDGKIVLAGYTNTGNAGSYFALARFNTDGSFDSTFSNDGKQTTDFGFYAEIGNSAALQSDGKIVMAGSVFTGSNYDSVDVAVARYNTDGSLDNTFSNDGKQITDINLTDDFSSTVIIQNDGKIVVTGRSSDGTKNNFSLVRYDTDGGLDNTFSDDGKQMSDFGSADYFGEAAALQPDGKIVMAGYTQIEGVGSSFAVARYNTDGQLDTTFNKTGLKTRDFGSGFEVATSVAIQNNGKIIIAGGTNGDFTLARYNNNGSADTSFNADGVQITRASGGDDRIQGLTIAGNELYAVGYGSYPATLGVIAKYLLTQGTIPPTVSIANPADNATFILGDYIKIDAVAADADGTITKVEFYSDTTLLHTEYLAAYGFQWKHVPVGNYTITAKAYDNSGLITTSAPVHITVAENQAPTVSITSPANNQSFAGPTTIRLRASAKDADGAVTKVEFYNGTTLLHAETDSPYTYTWVNVPVGTYAITAKATDNRGTVTISENVNISVVPNLAPTVSITNPANGESLIAGANIFLLAAAAEPDGSVSKVEFYNGDALLGTQYFSPYTFNWINVAAGTYTITAKATDNLGLSATSLPVTITVSDSASIVNNRPSSQNEKTALNNALSMRAFPNPAKSTINLQTHGLQPNKPATISIISNAGIVLKNIQISNAAQTTQLNVSSLTKGVYTIKMISGNKVLYKQFVKL